MHSFGSLIKKLGRRHSKNSYKKVVEAKEAKTIHVPKGCLAMYVGEEEARYEVPVKYLSLPMFKALLKQYQEDDLEAKIDGPIRLPCTTEIFDQFLKVAKQL